VARRASLAECCGTVIRFGSSKASATEIRSLALPGHVFRVIALDGNPVPTPAEHMDFGFMTLFQYA
jgi:hypothetical protein